MEARSRSFATWRSAPPARRPVDGTGQQRQGIGARPRRARSDKVGTRLPVGADEREVPMAPGRVGWVDHVVWWHAYPLGVVGAEETMEAVEGVAHRLPRLEAWLDHLISLGANGLLLGPVFASATHGYDTVDYFRIDPRLAGGAAFDPLVAAC